MTGLPLPVNSLRRKSRRAFLRLQSHPTRLQPRFDVIEVYGTEDSPLPPRIHHWENAFGG